MNIGMNKGALEAVKPKAPEAAGLERAKELGVGRDPEKFGFSDDVKLRPYIGTAYAEGVNARRVLMVGHCPYGTERTAAEMRPMLTNIVATYLDPSAPHTHWMNDFTRIIHCIDPESPGRSAMLDSGEARHILGRIAFTDYVQDVVPDNKAVPAPEQYRAGAPALREVVDKLKPDVIFLWGDKIPSPPLEGAVRVPTRYEGLQAWRVEGADGKPGPVMVRITHPSSPQGFDLARWKDVFADALCSTLD